ncbi:MAG: hypothetical protein QM778_18380 [Myxococcales bacterium]
MTDLTEFLDLLAGDPRLRSEFAAAPAATLARAGVNTEGLELPERMDLGDLEERLSTLAEVSETSPVVAAASSGLHTPVWSGAAAETAVPEASRRRLRRGRPLPGIHCPSRLESRREDDSREADGSSNRGVSPFRGDGEVKNHRADAGRKPSKVEKTAVTEATPSLKGASEAPLPGAWFATNGTAISRALSIRPQGVSMVSEAIFGQDDRQHVPDASAPPYSWLCALVITAGNGTRWFGTGWLAGPRLVVTAGHCVFMPTQGGWAREITVLPGRNGALTEPRIRASQFHSVEGWVVNGRSEVDYGAIVLPEGSLAADWGYFGYGALDDGELLESLFNIAGYPIDKEQGTLWAQVNNLLTLSGEVLIYENDTYGGMSGCPVIRWDELDYVAVGIHNYGDLVGNRATRINQSVFDNINFWKTL